MNPLLLASQNQHKFEEFQELFEENFQLETPDEKLEVIEDEKTYHGNALKKAKAYYDHFKRMTMADDSGLEVEALPHDLGVQTARFGGEGLTSQERYELLLKKMEKIPQDQRKAKFICVLCFYRSPEEIYFFEGLLPGHIGTEAKGEGGFGYDPVFFPLKLDGQSLAMNLEFKKTLSHRAMAVKQALKFQSLV